MADHVAQAQPAGHVDDTHHVIGLGVYYRVFAALIVLLIATCWAANFQLGPWNTVIAISIALAKMLLIILYFMHVKYSSTLVRIFAGAAFVWLSILFVYTITDYMSRGWLPVPGK